MRNELIFNTLKYGNDEDNADEIARLVMKTWCDETWKYTTPTGFQFRPGMLSWNYWAGADASFTIATPDGRNKGTFLSNAICPVNGSDKKGPTAVTNSVGADNTTEPILTPWLTVTVPCAFKPLVLEITNTEVVPAKPTLETSNTKTSFPSIITSLISLLLANAATAGFVFVTINSLFALEALVIPLPYWSFTVIGR